MFCGYNSVHSTIDSQNSDIKGCSSKSVHKYCPESITQLTQLSVLKIIQPDCKIINWQYSTITAWQVQMVQVLHDGVYHKIESYHQQKKTWDTLPSRLS